MSLDDSEAGEPARDRSSRPELRKVTDARALRALTHPVRIALIEELTLRGAMTATEVGQRIGESPTTCSFHLRQLAKYGFVEEAGGGRGRARPWRMTSIGFQSDAVHDDPAAEVAAYALLRLFRERGIGRYRQWLETQAAYPRRWREAAGDAEYLFYLTAEELEQLNEKLSDLLMPLFQERLGDPSRRPPGSVPVEMLVFSYPIDPPAAEDDVQSPAGQSPAGQSPAGQSPAGQSPAGQSPAGQSPAGQSPAGQSPAGQSPAIQSPTGQPG